MKPTKAVAVVIVLGFFLHGCALVQEKPKSVGKPPIANIVKPGPSKLVQPPKIEIGHASWYGANFDGKKTASGVIFDESAFTAAHRSLPLGSRVRVTNLENEKFVEVEVNDRGPFVPGRIIDLSRAAARALGIIEDGIARVRVELLALP